MRSVIDQNVIMWHIPIYLESEVCGEITALLHSENFLFMSGLDYHDRVSDGMSV